MGNNVQGQANSFANGKSRDVVEYTDTGSHERVLSIPECRIIPLILADSV